MNPRVIEMWINNTLIDSEHMEIPGCIVADESIKPLTRYGIDRAHLIMYGLTSGEVDRVYRSLFVYSIGFFNLMNGITS
jgi:hypothetical protein